MSERPAEDLTVPDDARGIVVFAHGSGSGRRSPRNRAVARVLQDVLREVFEESGITIALTGVSGIYSDPAHIVVYSVEGARQQVAVCMHARPARPGELPRPDDDETTAAAWFTAAETTTLTMHPDVRRRLAHGLAEQTVPHVD